MRHKKGIYILLGIGLIAIFIAHGQNSLYLQAERAVEGTGMVQVSQYDLPHSSQIFYAKMGQQLLQYREGTLYAYHMEGNLNWNYPFEIKDPLIKANLEYVAVVDNQKGEMHLLDEAGQLVYTIELGEKVDSLYVSQEGHTLLLGEWMENQIQNIYIYNPLGEKTGKLVNGDGQVINSDLSGKENHLAIYTLHVNQGKLNGSLKHYTLAGNLLSTETHENRLLLKMFFDSHANLILCYDQQIESKNIKFESVWNRKIEGVRQIEYDNKESLISLYTEAEGTGLLSGRPQNRLRMIKWDGSLLGEKELTENIVGMDQAGRQVLLYDHRSLYLYDESAVLIQKHQYQGDILKAFLFSDKYLSLTTKEKLVFLKIQ